MRRLHDAVVKVRTTGIIPRQVPRPDAHQQGYAQRSAASRTVIERDLELAAVPQIFRDACDAKGVAADLRGLGTSNRKPPASA
jgi:hypothetical protein